MLYKTSNPDVVHREISKLKPLNYNQFRWWRRFDSKTQPLPRGAKFLNRIKNGEFEFSHYYWQWKLTELELNDLYKKYKGDIRPILMEHPVDLARRKRLIEDFEKDENARLESLQKGFLNEFVMTKEEYLENASKSLIPPLETLREDGVLAVNIADSIVNGIPQKIPYLFIEYVEKNTPLKFIGEIIWSKKSPRGNGKCEDVIRPKNKIEYIMLFALNPEQVKYRKLIYRDKHVEPKITNGYKDVNKHGVVSKKRKTLSKGYKSIKNHIYEQEIENIIITSVGENHDVRKIIKDGHPAVMSPMLPITIILMYTDEGDWVYDCMSGSNVVGRSSQILNRRSLSTEISKRYFNIGCKMLSNAINEFDRESLDIINDIAYREFEELIAA